MKRKCKKVIEGQKKKNVLQRYIVLKKGKEKERVIYKEKDRRRG